MTTRDMKRCSCVKFEEKDFIKTEPLTILEDVARAAPSEGQVGKVAFGLEAHIYPELLESRFKQITLLLPIFLRMRGSLPLKAQV